MNHLKNVILVNIVTVRKTAQQNWDCVPIKVQLHY